MEYQIGRWQDFILLSTSIKKVKELIKIFNVIETLDTESSAKKLSDLKSKNFKIPKIFIQINIGRSYKKEEYFLLIFLNF